MIRVRVRHLAAADPLRELASTAQLMASVARGRERGEGGAIQLAILRGDALAVASEDPAHALIGQQEGAEDVHENGGRLQHGRTIGVLAKPRATLRSRSASL